MWKDFEREEATKLIDKLNSKSKKELVKMCENFYKFITDKHLFLEFLWFLEDGDVNRNKPKKLFSQELKEAFESKSIVKEKDN